MPIAAYEHIDAQPGHSLGCLRGVSLFSHLSDEEIACFHNAAQARFCEKGKVLFIEKEPAEFFYVICSGWIKLFHTTAEGEEVIVDMLTAGQMAGESSIFEQDIYTSSAQAIEDVRFLSIPSVVLKEQIRLSPTLALSMLSSMSRHYRRRYRAMAMNAMLNAPQRIGGFLLSLCPRDKKKGVAFDLPYDKALIAYTLGMKNATFSRALNILRQKTSVRVNGSRVEIDSVEPLVKFVYGALSAENMPRERRSVSRRSI